MGLGAARRSRAAGGTLTTEAGFDRSDSLPRATNGHAREARLPGLPRAKCVALCPKSCRRFELGDRHVLDCVDRKLQEARAHRTERLGIAGGEETVGAVA